MGLPEDLSWKNVLRTCSVICVARVPRLTTRHLRRLSTRAQSGRATFHASLKIGTPHFIAHDVRDPCDNPPRVSSSGHGSCNTCVLHVRSTRAEGGGALKGNTQMTYLTEGTILEGEGIGRIGYEIR
jgi:hypothetical protein